MQKIRTSVGYNDSRQVLDLEGDEDVVKPLSQSEAQALREKNPALSPWLVLVGQAGAGVVVALIAWWVTGSSKAGWSALYGAAAVVIPGALFARGMMSKKSLTNPAAAVAGFFLWELVKIVLTVAMLMAATKVIVELSWLAMLAGFVVTMKVYWLALWLRFIRPVGKKY